MDAELLKTLQDLSNECDWCVQIGEDCKHCRDKAFLVDIACAWAFDLGQQIGIYGFAYTSGHTTSHYGSDCCGAPCSATLG